MTRVTIWGKYYICGLISTSKWETWDPKIDQQLENKNWFSIWLKLVEQEKKNFVTLET